LKSAGEGQYQAGQRCARRTGKREVPSSGRGEDESEKKLTSRGVEKTEQLSQTQSGTEMT